MVATPSPTARKNSELSWKLVGTGLYISPGGTNLEFWLEDSGLGLIDRPAVVKELDRGHDFMMEKVQGQEFILKPNAPFPDDRAAQAGALAHMEGLPNPDECAEAVTERSQPGIPVTIGGHYCIRSSADYIYLLAVQSRTPEGDGLVVDLQVAVNGPRVFRPAGVG
ncbi:hypothetical protein Vqi01_47280 [Micromonospora qiuiae]|uniref:Uncharacterized protein n=2 Tax=Micromonospora qiuiae TaxID=502268 RepID=A0ABQ4JGB6_9ACTN|nr:hypothetical protein Vqi01_47280 [Micromonospora qiuiae]